MRAGRTLLVLGAAGLLSACVQQTGISSGGSGSGGTGQRPGSPIATASEIDRFVRDGSAFIEHYDRGERTHIECGYFARNYNYNAIVFELDYDSYTRDGMAKYSAAWGLRGDRLCFLESFHHSATSPWFRPPALADGCYAVEWSTKENALILISPRDEVLATIITSDGPGKFRRSCNL